MLGIPSRLTILAATAMAVGCSAPRHAEFTRAYQAGDLVGAEAIVDELIADDGGAKLEDVTASKGLSGDIDVGRKDTYLYLLEKASVRLAFDDPDTALDLLRRSRDVLDEKLGSSDVEGYFKAVLTDDRSIDYVGADYEHVLVPTYLALAEIVDGGQERLPYAFQISAKQEQIAQLDFGEGKDGQGYNPRKDYRRVPIGKYLEGVILEDERSFDEAEKAYLTALQMAGGSSPLIEAGIARCNGELRAEKGDGLLHVLYLGGRGPTLVESTSPVTELARTLAQIGAIFGGVDEGAFGQAPVPVPAVQVNDSNVPPLSVASEAGGLRTEPLMDVNRVALEQLEARMPWIVARAVVRRAAKQTAASVAADAAIEDPFANALTKIFATAALTGGERADTRSWTALPASFQATQTFLPAGVQLVDVGPLRGVPVRIRTGYASFLVVVQPNLALEPIVLVDRKSRVPEGARVDAPASFD
ncbi:MAG: hypothetical protein AAFZ65_19770, partial [Planctomycetota bacterium]